MRLADLHVTKGLQPRGDRLDADVVKEYTAAMAAGSVFPPVIAYRVTDKTYPGPAVVAGFHRVEAAVKAGLTEVAVDLREGTFAEAWLAGYLSNLTHGLRYTNQQKRSAVERACLLFRDESARALADRLGVGDKLVGDVRKELVAAGKLPKPETVIGRDGRELPASREQSDKSTAVKPQWTDKNVEPSPVPHAQDSDPGSATDAPEPETEHEDTSGQDATEEQAGTEPETNAETVGGEVAEHICNLCGEVFDTADRAFSHKLRCGQDADEPPGPFDDLLSKSTAYSRAVSVRMNDGTPEGDALKAALSHAGLVYHIAKVTESRRYRSAFTHPRPVRHLIRQVAKKLPHTLTKREVEAAMADGEDDE